MNNVTNTSVYDLEERTLKFSKNIRFFSKKVKIAYRYEEDLTQLVRSSGSIGANYIEGTASLGKKDFIMRMRICRKEAKESYYWLRLLEGNIQPEVEDTRQYLVQESLELTKIFSVIVKNSKTKLHIES